MLFRVLKKVESGNDELPEEKWLVLPLQEVAGGEKSGPFDPRIGAFENSGAKDQIFFHAIPDGNPLPRTLGGGRFDFKTTGIPDGKGGLVTLKIGDQIEYCVEVFADKAHLARSAEQLTLVQLSTLSLEDVTKKAVAMKKGTVYSVIPKVNDGKTVFDVAIAGADGKANHVMVDETTK